MQKITQDSLRELNSQVDAAHVLELLGASRVDRRGEQVVAACPLCSGRGTMTVEAGNFATCSSGTCPAAQRRSMLWIYCKGSNLNLQDGAQRLADQSDVLLEYEGDEPAAVRPIEIVSAPAEIGPVVSASIVRETEDTSDQKKLFCPILREECIEERCRLWVVDWIEDKNVYRRNCAITFIAVGLLSAPVAGAKK